MKNVVISTYAFAFDAYIIKGRPEAEGVPAYVHDDQYITMDWTMSQAIGGVKVSVPECYQDQAIAVLQSNQNDHYALDPLGNYALSAELAEDYIPEQPLHCPACQSDKISRLEWSRRLSILVLFALLSPLAFSQRHYSCDDCGKVFAPEPGIFSRPTFIVLTIASVLLTLLIMFALVLQGDSYGYTETYHSRANGGDMIIMMDGEPEDWEGEDFPSPPGPYTPEE